MTGARVALSFRQRVLLIGLPIALAIGACLAFIVAPDRFRPTFLVVAGAFGITGGPMVFWLLRRWRERGEEAPKLARFWFAMRGVVLTVWGAAALVFGLSRGSGPVADIAIAVCLLALAMYFVTAIGSRVSRR